MTLSSGIIAALPQLVKNPTSIPSLLATQLPQASNFFLTYTILQGLTGTASGFLQIVPLAIYYVKLFLMGSTPRSVYTIKYTLRNIQWGTLFPATTLIAVISTYYHSSYLKCVDDEHSLSQLLLIRSSHRSSMDSRARRSSCITYCGNTFSFTS